MKFHLKFIICLATFFLIIGSCSVKKSSAEEAEKKEPTISGIIMIDSASMYIDKLSGETLYRGFVMQPSGLVVFEKLGGLYLGITGTKVADGEKFTKSSKNSIDYIIGAEKEIGIMKIDAGYGFSDIKNSKGDLHFLYIIAELPNVIENLTPYVMTEVDIPVKKKILAGGFLYRAGAKYALKVSKQEIVFDLSVAGHDGAYGYKSQTLNSGRLTIFTIVEMWGLELKPEINLQKRFGLSPKHGGIADNVIWIGLRIALPIYI